MAADRDRDGLVAALAAVGSCRAATWSPDGERLALVSDLSGLPAALVVPAGGGWPARVTGGDDPVAEVRWAPSGDLLAVAVDPGGGMNRQIDLVAPDGSRLRRLTPGGSENTWLGPWSGDGARLAVSSNRRRADRMDAWLIDAASGAWRLLAEGRPVLRVTDVDLHADRVLLHRQATRGDSDQYLLDVASGKETCLTGHAGRAVYRGAVFGADGAIYAVSDAGREFSALVRIPLDAAGRPQAHEVVAARDGADLSEFAIQPGGTTAALLWNEAGRSDLAWLDVASGRLLAGPELPGEIAADPALSPDGAVLALTIAGAALPSDVWTVRLGGGEPLQVTRSPHPGVPLAELVRPELVRFGAHDDLALTGWLYRPRDRSGPGPLVLSFHGGPESQERPRFNATYQALLARGIAVFAPNVRGSSGFGRTFVDLDNGARRADAVRDIRACIDAVVRHGAAAPGRIGIMGGSYGGYMVLAGLTEYPDLLACGADLYGVVNFETFFRHTEPWMAAISKVEYGDPDTEADMLRALSPIHRLDRVRAPTLVLHGANDTNVPVVEAEQVVEGLRARGVPVRYVLFPDEGHGFRKAGNRLVATGEVSAWFAKHL